MKMIRMNFFAVIVVLAVFLAGCQKTGNYYDAIPADASVIFGANVKSITEKGDVKNLLGTQLSKITSTDLDAVTAEKLEQLLTDPQTSGLDLGEKVFFYLSGQNGGLVAKVADEVKITEFFEALQKEGKCEGIEKKSGYSQVKMGNSVLYAYDNRVLLVGFADRMEENETRVASLIAQDAKLSMGTKEVFQKMIASKSDICYSISMGAILDQYGKNIPVSAMMLPKGVDMKKLDMVGSADFENGKMVLETEYFSTDQALMDLFKKQNDAYNKLNNTFLSSFSASTLLYFAFNLNGEKTYEMLEAYNMLKDVQMPQGFPDLQKLISSFDGDVAFGLQGLSAEGMPSVALYAQVKDSYLVDALAGMEQQFGMFAKFTKKGGQAYEVMIPSVQTNLWFGMQDKYFYMTNDAAVYSKIGQKVENPLSDSESVALLKKSYGGYSVNIAAILDLPMVKMMSGSSVSAVNTYKMFSVFDYFEIYTDTMQHVTCVLSAKDQNQNILKTIIETAKGLEN